MFQLLETIKICNGEIFNIGLHSERMNRARRDLFGEKSDINLAEEIRVQDEFSSDTVKCRIVYSKIIERIEFEKYTARRINTLKCVECNDIDYKYKYYDRCIFSDLLKKKESANEIIIIKSGLVTDTSYTNIAFYDGSEWHTPSKPLLKGTKREELLRKNILIEKDIKASDIRAYQKASLINAFLDLGTIEIITENITDI